MAASACQRCGAPAGPTDRFCHACGSALHTAPAVAPVAPIAPIAPPGAPITPPVAELAPLATPLVGRRLSTGYIVSATVAFMVVMAVIASSIAFLLGERTTGGGTTPTSPPSGETGKKVIDVRNISVEVPAGWNVLRQSADTITVSDPKANALSLRSDRFPQTFTLDSVQDLLLDRARDASPDARVCAGPEPAAVPGGPSTGRYFVICSTLIPQGGGRAVTLDDAYYFAVGDGGVVLFVMQLTASPDALEEFATVVRQLSPPNWKLFR